MKIRLAGLEKESIVDGPGIRYVIFVQGCPFHCEGCHNPESWAFDGGLEIDCDDVIDDILKNPILQGVTFSGGEPFYQPEALAYIAKSIKKERPNFDIVTFTGNTYENLVKKDDNEISNLLYLTDILIDGPYINSLRDLTLKFRGSSNQRIIYLREGNILKIEE